MRFQLPHDLHHMDRELPLELLYEISNYLPIEDYLRFQRCSLRTLGIKSLTAVGFEEYQLLASKYNDVFQNRLVVTLKDAHIYSDSIYFLVRKLHQFELMRILESKHAWKLTPQIVNVLVNSLIKIGRFSSRSQTRDFCPDIVLQLLIKRRIVPNYVMPWRGETALHLACNMG
jgi:hypothetical protein